MSQFVGVSRAIHTRRDGSVDISTSWPGVRTSSSPCDRDLTLISRKLSSADVKMSASSSDCDTSCQIVESESSWYTTIRTSPGHEPRPTRCVAAVWTLFVALLLCCPCDIVGASLRPDKDDVSESNRLPGREKRQIVGDNVHNYLMSFGYLPQSDLETGNLRTDDQLQEAIKTLQVFGNIPATGKLDSATRDLLKKPRCGLPDIATSEYRAKRYTLNGQRWHYTNLTWSLQKTNELRHLDAGRVRGELSRALDVWAQHSKLTFQEVNSDRADILISFEKGYHEDGYPFDGRGQILAHAFFPGSGRGGDAHFDSEENWLLHHQEGVEGTSLFGVAAHEFGHSLGLSHSSVEGALMYPWYQGMKSNFRLPEDDINGIQQIYGSKERLWGKIPEYNPGRENSPPRQPAVPDPPPYPYPTKPPRHWPHHPTTPAPHPTKPSWKNPPRTYPTRPRVTYAPSTVRPAVKRPHTTSPTPAGEPDTCDTSYDAISLIRSELFIFKGRYLWRIRPEGLMKDYPAEIDRLWKIPQNATHVDAVYERLSDKKIVFFIGKHYYLYEGNTLQPGYPRPLTALGLPRNLEKIDGAMVWGHNKKTYFYSGTMYWRFDEDVGKVELDYPRDMSMWRGVGYNIDSVFQWKDGRTYFFKGKGFWKFNDLNMRVENEKQTLSAPVWMHCARKLIPLEEKSQNLPVIQSSASTLCLSFMGIMLVIATPFSLC